MAHQEFPLLFSPIRIGSVEIKNRLVMAPMGTNYPASDGTVSEQLKAFYVRRAQGGVGLITIENAYVERRSKGPLVNMLRIDDDKVIPGYRELTDAIHHHGAKVFCR